jgi:hypothetical protein
MAAVVEKGVRRSEKINNTVLVEAKLTKGYTLMGFLSGGPTKDPVPVVCSWS